MAAQQIHIAETIRSMKLAFKRKPDDSGSEDDYQPQTNRGNKLSRSARYARVGRLDNTGGIAYKRRIDHAGYNRATISKNPVLYDSEGEAVSPRSSDDERVHEATNDNPYGGVQLEALLRPLTSLTQLTDHPSLSTAYHDKALTKMAEEAASMLRVERENLWRAKRLLKRFEGDADWAPGRNFETEEDLGLLYQMNDAGDNTDVVKAEAGDASLQPDDANAEGIITLDHVKKEQITNDEQNHDHVMTTDQHDQGERAASADPNSETASTSASNMHAMTTRARARSPRASASASPSPSDSASTPVINPWFITPATGLPDRDLGLPQEEAEATRKMLLLYCQKQEQVVQSLDALYSGLQKGDRLRKYILASSKAAGHLVLDGKNGLVTEMSDGEDWYDPQEYGRLEKGKDEVEDVEEEGRRGGRRRRVVGRV